MNRITDPIALKKDADEHPSAWYEFKTFHSGKFVGSFQSDLKGFVDTAFESIDRANASMSELLSNLDEVYVTSSCDHFGDWKDHPRCIEFIQDDYPGHEYDAIDDETFRVIFAWIWTENDSTRMSVCRIGTIPTKTPADVLEAWRSKVVTSWMPV